MKTAMRWLALPALLLIMRSTLAACPVCYGASDSPLTAGMNAAILVMLGIVGFVLSSIVGFFYLFWKRGKQQRSTLSEQFSVNQHGRLEESDKKGVVEWNNF
jgi:hypothetical protein